jgi:hypothetical protein
VECLEKRKKMGEIEDEEDLDLEQRIRVPHKNDLDLGRNLVFEFVEEYLPDDYERVRKMFRRTGAYTRYKALLERRGLLKERHHVERTVGEHANPQVVQRKRDRIGRVTNHTIIYVVKRSKLVGVNAPISSGWIHQYSRVCF